MRSRNVELFIFARFLKGFGLLVQRPCYWCSAPFGAGMQKHKDFQCFLKVPRGSLCACVECLFWHHSNALLAVVLFFLPEGESEREMGGNPPPLTLR